MGKLSAIGCFILSYGLICQRYSDTEAATYLLLQSLAMLGSLVANWGLGPVIIFRLRNSQNSQSEVVRLVSIAFIIFSAAAILATVVMVSLTWIPQIFKVDLKPFGIYLASWLILVGLSQLLGETVRAYERFGAAACLTGANNGGMLVNVLYFVALLGAPANMQFHGILMLQLGALVIAVVFGLLVLFQCLLYYPPPGTVVAETAQTTKKPISLKSVFFDGAPILISQFTVIGFVQFETILIGALAPNPSDIAAYGAIRRMMTLVAAPLLLVNATLPTFIVDFFSKKKLGKLETLLRAGATFAMLPAIFILAAMIVLPGFVLSWFDPTFAQFAIALQIMSVGQIVFVLAGSSGLTLRMTGFQTVAMVSSLIAMGIYLVMSPLLIIQLGVVGAAIASCIIVSLRNIASIGLVKHFVGIWTLPKLSMLNPASLKLLTDPRNN